ncbi:phosphatidate cytidylyltransferase [Granulicella sp. 5B5]|uniref:phosphatidate cytidylyltransferase n=1 Tax=Granulicella sp. 5B5 TaxID=1617967 RepID=UPI0015F6C59F|nr:phosphatidate cytidylyltransferase [Granulicella sp. 5B5]QMV18096.1 phosphatidate cytidylyltransferase [Granulicella sp. 5B5]
MKRILTALVLVAAVAALIFFGKPWMLTVAAALVAGLAAWEFRGFTVSGGCPLPIWWTFTAVAAFFLAVFFQPDDTITVVSTVTLILFAVAAFRTSLERVLWETAGGVLMLIYVAYPLTLIPKIFNEENGTAILLFLFLCVWTGDIAALYIGKRFGKHKLAPQLSPNKTWEGTIASLLGSVIVGMALIFTGDWFSQQGSSFSALHTTEPWWFFIILALVLNAAAQFGDLLESALKRGAGVKDSGTLLPGHGGVLDRIDALLVAAPVLWLIIAVRHYFSLGSL